MLEIMKFQFNFYDFKELKSKDDSDIIINFKDHIESTTYSDLQFYPTKSSIFKYKYKKYINLMNYIFYEIEDEYCIINKYNEKWVVDKELTSLYSVLKTNQIHNSYSGGLKVYKKDKINEIFFESVLKYNSFIEFIFVDSRVIITPTDHMDVFFNTNNDRKMEVNLKKIVDTHFNDVFDVKSK